MSYGSLESGHGNAPMAEINMVPLIDVMLVLLVIFLVTAPLLAHSVKVDLPQSRSAPQHVTPRSIQLALKTSSDIFWNAEPIDATQLSQRLEEAAGQSPAPELHIRAERTLAYEHVAKVMSEAARLGVTRIGFVTHPVQP